MSTCHQLMLKYTGCTLSGKIPTHPIIRFTNAIPATSTMRKLPYFFYVCGLLLCLNTLLYVYSDPQPLDYFIFVLQVAMWQANLQRFANLYDVGAYSQGSRSDHQCKTRSCPQPGPCVCSKMGSLCNIGLQPSSRTSILCSSKTPFPTSQNICMT